MDFKTRHIGIDKNQQDQMCEKIGQKSLDDLAKHTLAKDIEYTIDDFQQISEQEFENHINKIGKKKHPDTFSYW